MYITTSKRIARNSAYSTFFGTKIAYAGWFKRKATAILRWHTEAPEYASKLAGKEGIPVLTISPGPIGGVLPDKLVSLKVKTEGGDTPDGLASHAYTPKDALEFTEAMCKFKIGSDNLCAIEKLSHLDSELDVFIDEEIDGSFSAPEIAHWIEHLTNRTGNAIVYSPDFNTKKRTVLNTLGKEEKRKLKALYKSGRVTVVTHRINQISLIERARTVFTIRSHTGYDALVRGKSVYCSALSDYSICKDTHAGSGGISIVDYTLDMLNGGCYFKNPITNRPCTAIEAVKYINANQRYYPNKRTVIQDLNPATGKPFSRIQRDYLSAFTRITSSQEPAFHKRRFNLSTLSADAGPILRASYICDAGTFPGNNIPTSVLIDDTGDPFNYACESRLSNSLKIKESENQATEADKIAELFIKLNDSDATVPDKLRSTQFTLVIDDTDSRLIEARRNFSTDDCIDIALTRNPDNKICIANDEGVWLLNGRRRERVGKKGDVCAFLKSASETITVDSPRGLLAIAMKKRLYCLGTPFYYGYGLTAREIRIDGRQSTPWSNFIIKVLRDYPIFMDGKGNYLDGRTFWEMIGNDELEFKNR